MNRTTISSYSELNVFKKIRLEGEISSKLPKDLFGIKVYGTRESCQ